MKVVVVPLPRYGEFKSEKQVSGTRIGELDIEGHGIWQCRAGCASLLVWHSRSKQGCVWPTSSRVCGCGFNVGEVDGVMFVRWGLTYGEGDGEDGEYQSVVR